MLLEIRLLNDDVNQLQHARSVNLFDELYDMKHCATVITMNGNIQKVKLSNRNYLRWLNQKIREHDDVRNNTKRRFTARPFFLTDGVRLSTTYVDWTKSKRDDMSARYLKELRRTTREHLVHVYHPLPVTDPDLSLHYQGIVGLDFGQVCAVASVYRPTDSTLPGSQLIVKRSFLYGKTADLVLWQEKRKRRSDQDILGIEQQLSVGSTRGTLADYHIYLQALKEHNRGMRLMEFYSHPSIARKVWENKMSQRSAIDKTCSLIINQAAQGREDVDPRPQLFAFGMDGLSEKARKGQRSPMDHKVSRALFRKLRQLNARRRRPMRHALTRVDEYKTSKTCCRCIKSRGVLPMNENVEYLGRPPRIGDARSRVDNTGQFRTFRVVRCNTCNRIFHRDGNAAENMCTIARYYLRYNRRQARFIRPSRVHPPAP